MATPKRSRKTSRRDRHADSPMETLADHPDASSPCRPSKRRKQSDSAALDVSAPVSASASTGPSAAAVDSGSLADVAAGADESHTTDIADDDQVESLNDDDKILARVVQHLASPADFVQASQDHSNTIHESSEEGVRAFAKLAAADWTYYITDLNTNIGRSSEVALDAAGDDNKSSKDVHIDLGPSKMISRQHARIYFRSSEEKWYLQVKGRNALRIDGEPWHRGQDAPITSGEVIEIAGIEMVFALPISVNPLHINQLYLNRAGITATSANVIMTPLKPRSGLALAESQMPRGSAAAVVKPLVPAPPDFHRSGTPPGASRHHRLIAPQAVSPVPILLNPNEIDLSLDEFKHIKPQYSYAQMITQAILNTEDEKLNLNGIYNFITNNYSYYRHQLAAGWQNSIRHNLSLNKAFEKVARSTDEPGKGMKWQLVPEVREEMIRTAYRGGRGGHRGSSNPSSPSQTGQINQPGQINYINHGPRDIAAMREAAILRRYKISSPSRSPRMQQQSIDHVAETQTPVRNARKPLPEDADHGHEPSSLPRPPRKPETETMESSQAENAPASPTLTSSFPNEDGASFITPAPLRVHPRLAPPSTAQRPSQHMPTSSPAPFWKYANIGSTPLKPAQFDMSPSKSTRNPLQNSSPPLAPTRSPALSPARMTTPGQRDPRDNRDPQNPTHPPPPPQLTLPPPEEDLDGFDLTKGFQSIGAYHAPVSRGANVAPAMSGSDESFTPTRTHSQVEAR